MAMSNSGGVNREHDRSQSSKLTFAILHGAIAALCIWLAFGTLDWPDQPRAGILALCAVLYWLRHLVTLFVLMQRRVALSEVLGLTAFMALFEVGFLLLGSGEVSGTQTPPRLLDWLGCGLVLFGSTLNTGSELQRWMWKMNPSANGRCYTEGLFTYSMHINYFGDTLLFTGWAILTASVFAWPIPIFVTASFIFFHIPALDAYLADRYGADFEDYKARTARFVPFIY